MFAAPELVESQPVEVFHEIEVSLELQDRVLTDRVVRGQERAESKWAHCQTVAEVPSLQ